MQQKYDTGMMRAARLDRRVEHRVLCTWPPCRPALQSACRDAQHDCTERPPLLSEVYDRLDASGHAQADHIIGRGQVPVTARRSDISGSFEKLPQPVASLLAKASRVFVQSWNSEITANFDREMYETNRALFGPLCSSIYPEIRFFDVRARWPNLVEALAAVGCTVPAKSRRPGPKGDATPKEMAWKVAQGILNDDEQRPPRGYGRLMALARLVNTKLAQLDCPYEDDSVRKMIGPSLREWEDKNPQQ